MEMKFDFENMMCTAMLATLQKSDKKADRVAAHAIRTLMNHGHSYMEAMGILLEMASIEKRPEDGGAMALPGM